MTRNLEVLRYEKRLKYLFDQSALLPEEPILIRSHWARYLCILVSGYLETSVQAILSQYARDKSVPYVANYVENRLNGFRSAKMSNIIALIRNFNPEWADYLAKETEGELADHINSIVKNRHKIAHGIDTSVSLGYVTAWYESAKKVIKLIEDLCAKK